MSALAAIRDDAVNFPLFLHVFGAMLLTGSLLIVASTTLLSRRAGADAAGLRRLGLKSVAIAVLPAYILMRVGAQLTESKENLPDEVEEQAWLGIGYITADLGALLILASVIVAAVGLKRMRADDGTDAGGAGQARAVMIISILLLVAYVIAIWAMSTKPE